VFVILFKLKEIQWNILFHMNTCLLIQKIKYNKQSLTPGPLWYTNLVQSSGFNPTGNTNLENIYYIKFNQYKNNQLALKMEVEPHPETICISNTQCDNKVPKLKLLQ
jgi:hypothetical protein